MSIKSLQHSSLSDNRFYRSMLAGNEYYVPFTPADDILEEIVLASSASSVTLSGLGAYTDYQHLQVRMTARTDRASSVDEIIVQLNADTGTNYTTHYLNGTGSAVESFEDLSINGMRVRAAGSTATSNVFAPAVIDILDFSSSSKNTTTRTFNHDAGNNHVRLLSGLWLNTAAVTSIKFDQLYGSNFGTGSRFSLIGVR